MGGVKIVETDFPPVTSLTKNFQIKSEDGGDVGRVFNQCFKTCVTQEKHAF